MLFNPTQGPVQPPVPPGVPAAAIPQPAPSPQPAVVIQPHHFQAPQGVDAARWLQEVGSQLSDQIQSARNRRNILAKQYEAATGANRAGLEHQLRILDQRIAQLEMDIADVGVQKAQTFPSTAPAADFNPGAFVSGIPSGLFVVLCFLLLLPVSFAAARRLWRRPKQAGVPPDFADAAVRLERVEQAVETIAIEIERVSEGQRYLSKILSPQGRDARAEDAGAPAASAGSNGAQPFPALGPGSPDAIPVQQRQEEVRVRRS